MKQAILSLIISTLIFVFNNNENKNEKQQTSSVESNSDINLESVKIGSQIWASKNLEVSSFSNGENIFQAKTREDWVRAGNEKKAAWCYYEFHSKNGPKYGKLYNWYAVSDYRGLAPKGWHIPTEAEWKKLIQYLGGEKNAATKMQSTNEWQGYSGRSGCLGSNSSNFNALPGGSCNIDGIFSDIGIYGGWWSASTTSSFDRAWMCGLNGDQNVNVECGPVYSGGSLKQSGLSVRCINNAKSSPKVIKNHSPDFREEINNGKDYFTIGSSESDVIEIMGTPNEIKDFEILNEKWLYYGNSKVVLRKGLVKEYRNTDRNLKIRIKSK